MSLQFQILSLTQSPYFQNLLINYELQERFLQTERMRIQNEKMMFNNRQLRKKEKHYGRLNRPILRRC